MIDYLWLWLPQKLPNAVRSEVEVEVIPRSLGCCVDFWVPPGEHDDMRCPRLTPNVSFDV